MTLINLQPARRETPGPTNPENRDDQDSVAPDPKILARRVSAPPGFPWVQWQAAQLEARLSAPLPISELVYQVKWLEPWSSNQPARLAVFYARKSDVGSGLVERVPIDETHVIVRFSDPAAVARERIVILGIIGGAGAAVTILVATLGMAMAARMETEARLQRLEARADARAHALEVRDHMLAEGRALENSGLADRDIDHVLGDLAWVAANKSDTARFTTWYWDRGYMAVEGRMAVSPFPSPDRPTKEALTMGAHGVHVFGIGPARASIAATPSPSPVTAEMTPLPKRRAP